MERATHDADFSKPLVLLARDQNKLVGGLIAEHVLAWLKISIMAVDPPYRGQGIGSSLLIDAERRAAAMGCKYLYADTMQYQAPQFYLKHGFQVAGQIPNWDSHGHTKFFMTKEL
ncbi:Acetyltransferase (GNAT) family protein [Bremerella volcania]|uniref:Acetyltransferase (GNAT) family protein n=2 Tax=Bremerella volcania TaxID=2527984 RepID=A0A518CFS4_9BACT|nr:Acetyltransferase (GNAT) family protein [Bremerella volcania]